MLKLVKAEPTLQGLKDSVQGIRRTANGSLLLKMQKPSDPATQKLHTAIKSAFSGKAKVAMLEDTVQVEIRDQDEMTTCEELLKAAYAEEECDIPAGAAPRMRKAYGDTQAVTVHLRPEHAQRLLDKGKIRVGWVVCRIRQITEPGRCYKCMGLGMSARCPASEATAKNMQQSCFRCGKDGHKYKTCTHGKPKCITCTRSGKSGGEADHSTLSRACPEYRKAMHDKQNG